MSNVTFLLDGNNETTNWTFPGRQAIEMDQKIGTFSKHRKKIGMAVPQLALVTVTNIVESMACMCVRPMCVRPMMLQEPKHTSR